MPINKKKKKSFIWSVLSGLGSVEFSVHTSTEMDEISETYVTLHGTHLHHFTAAV